MQGVTVYRGGAGRLCVAAVLVSGLVVWASAARAVDRVPGGAPAHAPSGGAATSGGAGGPSGAAAHRPLAVAPVAGEVVRVFVRPDGPYGRGHRGIDLAVRRREPVRAALAGTVRFAGAVAGETWITLTHAGGLETTYGGVDPAVAVGETVAMGQHVGRMRSGRRALDWGARLDGAYIDPIGLLTGWRVRLVATAEDG